MSKKKGMTRERAQEVFDTLRTFHKLERKAIDEVGWVAFHFSVSRAQGQRMLADAIVLLGKPPQPEEGR
jgi:hypothetical protein